MYFDAKLLNNFAALETTHETGKKKKSKGKKRKEKKQMPKYHYFDSLRTVFWPRSLAFKRVRKLHFWRADKFCYLALGDMKNHYILCLTNNTANDH